MFFHKELLQFSNVLDLSRRAQKNKAYSPTECACCDLYPVTPIALIFDNETCLELKRKNPQFYNKNHDKSLIYRMLKFGSVATFFSADFL